MTCILDFGEGGRFRGACVLLHRWQRNERKRQGGWGGGDEPSAATCHHTRLLPPLPALWQAGRGTEFDLFVFVWEWVCTAFFAARLCDSKCVLMCVHGCVVRPCAHASVSYLFICAAFVCECAVEICKFAPTSLTVTMESVTFFDEKNE